MLKLSMSRLLTSALPSLPSLAQCNSGAAQPQKLVFQITSNLNATSQPLVIQTSSLHTTTPERSRIKQTARHKAFWHIKKLNKAEDEPVSGENKEFLQVIGLFGLCGHSMNFVQALLTEQYQGPLKKELAPYRCNNLPALIKYVMFMVGL